MNERAAAYTSPRVPVAALVPMEATRILELGCSVGATARYIKERQPAEVVGVEVDPAYVGPAARVVDQLVIHDLNDPAWLDTVSGRFDCILAADVLEHLVDPWAVLRAAVQRLRPDGCVVLSLPNVRHFQTIIGLLRGRWPYRQRGIHDATHLRFFTLREIRGLTAQAGLRIEVLERSYRVLDRPSRLDDAASVLGWTPFRELFTYQYFLRARPAPEPVAPAAESVPPERE